MRKMKKTKKKAMGIEERIKREQFLQELKNPTPKIDKSAEDILHQIRKKRAENKRRERMQSPYDCGGNSIAAQMWDSLRKDRGIR